MCPGKKINTAPSNPTYARGNAKATATPDIRDGTIDERDVNKPATPVITPSRAKSKLTKAHSTSGSGFLCRMSISPAAAPALTKAVILSTYAFVAGVMILGAVE
jgi:hypothetical protein